MTMHLTFVLSPAVQRPTPESLQRLEHEYSLKEQLDPKRSARPIAIARHWDCTVVVLENPGGLPLDQLVGQQLDLAFSLRLAISLSTAIGHLHQRGIMHKDIKPTNVLVNSATCQCWLMGFGIASRLPRERQSPDLRMPGMDGLELQRNLLRTNRRIPIIFVSARASEDERIQAIAGGAVEFLRKPFSGRIVQIGLVAAVLTQRLCITDAYWLLLPITAATLFASCLLITRLCFVSAFVGSVSHSVIAPIKRRSILRRPTASCRW
jgi:serine/threonine protein kinase